MAEYHTMLYIGGLDSAQRGAIGTHTAGVIYGLRANNIKIHGIFLRDSVPDTPIDKITYVEDSFKSGMLRKILGRVKIALEARRIKRTGFDLSYARFDPFLTPFVVDSNTVIEYNDDVIDQINFAVRNGGFSFLGGRIRKIFYPPLFSWSERYCFRKCKSVVCVTRELADLVKKRSKNATVLFVPNGSFAKFDTQHSDKSNTSRVLTLGHFGTLTLWDGLQELLEALSLFKTTYPDKKFEFFIVGNGVMKNRLTNLVKELDLADCVTFGEPIPQFEVIKRLHAIDAVPLLKTISSYGLSPIKFYEALCVGCFLICSNIEHINEINPEEGMVVGFPLAAEEIATAINNIHENLEQIRSQRPDRAQKAELNHSWEARMKEFLNLIQ